MSEQIIEIVISELDFYLIERVRHFRVRATPYLSQVNLSLKLGLAEGYISKVENPKDRAKYNIRMLNNLAKALSLQSPKELMPDETLKGDIVRIRLKLKSKKPSKYMLDEKERFEPPYEVISITPLNEEETKLWSVNKLPYLTVIEK